MSVFRFQYMSLVALLVLIQFLDVEAGRSNKESEDKETVINANDSSEAIGETDDDISVDSKKEGDHTEKGLSQIMSDEEAVGYLKNWATLASKLYRTLLKVLDKEEGMKTMRHIYRDIESVITTDSTQKLAHAVAEDVKETLKNENAKKAIDKIADMIHTVLTKENALATFVDWFDFSSINNGLRTLHVAMRGSEDILLNPKTSLFITAALDQFTKIQPQTPAVQKSSSLKKQDSLKNAATRGPTLPVSPSPSLSRSPSLMKRSSSFKLQSA